MDYFSQFQLDKNILKVLEEIGYKTPTPIQQMAIPKIADGKDVIASAQTGTGKTAAFLLPALQMVVDSAQDNTVGPKVLVLVPTRELALQVHAEAKKYSKYLKRTATVCIFGGMPYPVQKRDLSRPHEILIATPGRLIDHMQQGRIELGNIRQLILDEADRMLDMGFINDVETIASRTPQNRQTLLFSATLDRKILSISKKLQQTPEEIRIVPDRSQESMIEQQLYFVDDIHHKVKLLNKILETTAIDQAIIFTSTKNQANVLSESLQDGGYKSSALHGDMDQRRRTRTINKLRKRAIRFLVATDVAGRGIDVPLLSHVINFDLTFQPEDFIHRIGRTGRAGAKGTAITFATYREEALLERIAKLTGQPLTVHTISGLEPKPKKPSKDRFSSSRRGPSPRARTHNRPRHFSASRRPKR